MDSAPKKRIQLSLAKLKALFSKNSYTLVATYCHGNDVLFIEARTPKFQKTFIINIPLKYKMVCDDTHRRLQISPLPASLVTSNQYEYISELKGPLIDCDLIAISSTTVCMHKNNGGVDYYKMGEQEYKDEEDEDSEDLGNVDQLIKSANEIMEKIDDPDEDQSEDNIEIGEDGDDEEQDVDGGNDEEPELSPEDLDQMKLVEPKNTDNTIELVFEDEEGDSIEDSVPLMENVVNADQPPKKEKKVAKTKKGAKDKKESVILEKKSLTKPESPKHSRKDNSLPLNIEDSDITLGIVYYCKEVGSFYKKADTLEEEIISAYNTLDDNENDMREGKIEEISELCSNIVQKVKDVVLKVKKDEEALKGQLLTLTAILDKTDALKLRMEKTPKKFTEVKPDIERINIQTKSTIIDTNMDLLKSRDDTEDILSSIKESLEEILNI